MGKDQTPECADITRVTQKLAPAHYLPIPVESTSSVRPRRRTSIPRRYEACTREECNLLLEIAMVLLSKAIAVGEHVRRGLGLPI